MAERNRIIREAHDAWKDAGLISPELHRELSALHPPRAWDLGLVIRWAMAIGASLVGIGLVSLVVAMLQSAEFLAALLAILMAAAFAGAWRLGLPDRRPRLPKTGQALELLACILLSADIFLVARILAPEGEHWPPLLLLTSACWFAVAYWRRHPAVLVMALLALAGWAGSESGYASGWGAYYLGLNYPLRFALASPFVILTGWLHARFFPAAFRPFAPVYGAVGLLYTNLALWILSIFGNHDELFFGQIDHRGELLLWSLLWLTAGIASFVLGAKTGNRQASGFGLVFIILNLYTRYFEYFWNDLDKWVFFLVLGIATLGVGILAERRLRRRRRVEPGPRQVPKGKKPSAWPDGFLSPGTAALEWTDGARQRAGAPGFTGWSLLAAAP